MYLHIIQLPIWEELTFSEIEIAFQWTRLYCKLYKLDNLELLGFNSYS